VKYKPSIINTKFKRGLAFNHHTRFYFVFFFFFGINKKGFVVEHKNSSNILQAKTYFIIFSSLIPISLSQQDSDIWFIVVSFFHCCHDGHWGQHPPNVCPCPITSSRYFNFLFRYFPFSAYRTTQQTTWQCWYLNCNTNSGRATMPLSGSAASAKH